MNLPRDDSHHWNFDWRSSGSPSPDNSSMSQSRFVQHQHQHQHQQYSPSAVAAAAARVASPQIRAPPIAPEAYEGYLAKLLQERTNLRPFTGVVPICSSLLEREINRMTDIISNQGFNPYSRVERESPFGSSSRGMNGAGSGMSFGTWGGQSSSERFSMEQANSYNLHQSSGFIYQPHIIKRVMRVEIPVEMYPDFNFVGRLLGPRGNSLKRMEQSTGCRFYIRGRGSIKEPVKEEQLRNRPGYEHLNENLHVLIEAEMPADIIDSKMNHAREVLNDLLKPVDESHDYIKMEQLRELAMLNGNLRDDSRMSGSISPFSNSEPKRPKTGI